MFELQRVLQSVAACCSVLRCVAKRRCTSVFNVRVAECVAACCSVLQRVAVCCKKMLRLRYEIFVQRELNLSKKTLKKRPICVKRDPVNPGVVTTPCQYTPLVRHVCPKRPIFVEWDLQKRPIYAKRNIQTSQQTVHIYTHICIYIIMYIYVYGYIHVYMYIFRDCGKYMILEM